MRGRVSALCWSSDSSLGCRLLSVGGVLGTQGSYARLECSYTHHEAEECCELQGEGRADAPAFESAHDRHQHAEEGADEDCHTDALDLSE